MARGEQGSHYSLSDSYLLTVVQGLVWVGYTCFGIHIYGCSQVLVKLQMTTHKISVGMGFKNTGDGSVVPPGKG